MLEFYVLLSFGETQDVMHKRTVQTGAQLYRQVFVS